jgi:phage-related protein
VKKVIRLDKRANKEINKFPVQVQAKIKAYLTILARNGKLEEPFAKKVDAKLFEIRVKYEGQWRILYAYLVDDTIFVLSAFHKKTQKAPIKELEAAKSRLKEYI